MVTRVAIQHASVDYPIFDVLSRSIKVSLYKNLSGGAPPKQVEALRNLSLEIRDGERIGLVGRNGAGKTTLLRLIAGLIMPTRGSAQSFGRVVPVIDRGIGIHPELSGLQNIELPLRLLGANSAEVARAKIEIPEFTGLGASILRPFKTYSEGMKARLVFALCTTIQADLLILDEWLGAGDIEFSERAKERLTAFVDKAGALVMASHSLELIERVSTKVLWIDAGEVRMAGPPKEVCDAYRAVSIARHEAAALA